MKSYWDMNREERDAWNAEKAKRGIDYDLEACLEYNPQQGFDVSDIERVVAVWEGERDEEDWRWVLELKDKRFVLLVGGCDYTGWDCQSSAESYVEKTAEDAAALVKIMEFFSWRDRPNNVEVSQELLRQIEQGKTKTWREQTDADMGLNS